MAIRIAHGAATRVCDLSDRFALQVRGPSDLGHAMEALRRARGDILDLGIAWASGVVAAPAGPLLLVDGDGVDDERLRTIPSLVGRRLEELAVREALVAVPSLGGSLDGLERLGPAVVLRLFPEGGATALAPKWVDVASEWLTTGLEPDDIVKARVLAVEADVRAADVPGLLHECATAPAVAEVVTGETAGWVRAAAVVVDRNGYPHVAIAAGGPDLDDGALIARADLLEDVARDLAREVAYACVDIEPSFGWLAFGPGPGAVEVLGALAGRFVPEAYPFQVLGPGHLQQLGGLPPGALPLPGGRVELRIDDPAADGPAVLGPCLAQPADVGRLLADGPVVVPDREPEADDVSPVVAAFLRWWERDGEPPPADDGLDERRRWLAADWLVGHSAATWMRAAGDEVLAMSLLRLGPLDGPERLKPERLKKATEILGASITAAAWRLEAAQPDAPDDADEESAWAAWEAVEHESGCIAAAEAATCGLDDHVVARAEQRVIDCSRDPAVRATLEGARRTVSDEAWDAAGRAVADVVWRRTWEAAGVDDLLDDPDHEEGDLAAREALAAGDRPWEAVAAIARMHERVDDEAWEVARRTAAALGIDAPRQVALAAAVAVAREASGAAARALARTDPAALRRVVAELRPSADALLARMIEIGSFPAA